ncbi:MAG: cobalamin transport system ATP-binding protein [Methanolobus sp.]|nr:cobalamin transport system ATP-binding protein [Methanolobus sp.]
MKDAPLISTSGLSIGYKHRNKESTIVSSNLNLDLMSGELVCLIGPNGAGKSTLIRTLIGMQPGISGDVHLAGKLLSDYSAIEKARVLSVVLTSQVSISHFRAFDVASLGRYPHTGWSGTLSEKDREIVSYSLAAVGASELSSRYMSELSDGEKQKVMIARGLAQDPSVLILDEPTAFLDMPHKIEINGDFYSGAPEDLILKGVFGSAFEMGGVHFDNKKGTFVISPEQKGNVTLIGEDNNDNNEFIWTSHALERAGYSICSDGNCDITIEIQNNNGDTCWRYLNHTAEHDFFSIADMIQFLCRTHEKDSNEKQITDNFSTRLSGGISLQ